MQTILIIGATSCIAEAVARLYAAQGARIILAGRNTAKLEMIATDLNLRGASEVQFFSLDANDSDTLDQVLEKVWTLYGTIDIALVAHGSLTDQNLSESNLGYAIGEFRNNAESVIACLILLAQKFETQGRGVIAVISSVAGDRGRSSNYLYGSAKAAVNAFASGVRGRLNRSGVHVLTIKPGFVATPMTAELDFPSGLIAKPETVAIDILQAITKRRNVLYTPWFWWPIMLVIRCLPESIFKRLKF